MKTDDPSLEDYQKPLSAIPNKVSVYAASKRFHNSLRKKIQSEHAKMSPFYAPHASVTILKGGYKKTEAFINEQIKKANFKLFPVFKTESGKEIFSNGTWIVRLKPGLDPIKQKRLFKQYNAGLVTQYKIGDEKLDLFLLRYQGSDKLFLNEVYKLNESPEVEYAYPCMINAIEYEDTGEPGNALYQSQSALLTALGIPDAWASLNNIPTAQLAVKVAVLDEGILTNHPDLLSNPPDAAPIVNIGRYDEMGVGLNCPAPNNGHGTAVAGIIRAVNNTLLIVGVAHEASLCDIRISYTDSNGNRQSDEAKIIAGIYHAITWGAKVINISWSHQFTKGIRDALKDALNHQIIICCAVGNYKSNASKDMKFPAYMATKYDIIAVGACDNTGKEISLSYPTANNWGSCNVPPPTVLAPGLSTVTLALNGGIDSNFNGTSAATAYISGIAALMATVKPQIKPAQVISLLRQSVGKGAGQMASAKVAMANLPNIV